jgi:hypothetical protein
MGHLRNYFRAKYVWDAAEDDVDYGVDLELDLAMVRRALPVQSARDG